MFSKIIRIVKKWSLQWYLLSLKNKLNDFTLISNINTYKIKNILLYWFLNVLTSLFTMLRYNNYLLNRDWLHKSFLRL